MSQISFCLVTTFYPPQSFGGDAVHVHRLANGLAKRGHRVRVVHSPDAYRILGGPKRSEGPPNHPGVEVVPVETGALGAVGTYLTGAPTGYRRRLDAVVDDGFDVIHIHNPSLLGGPGILSVGSALRLYTATEHWLLCPTHVLFRNGREVCTERTCWRCTVHHRRPPQLWRSTGLIERALTNVDLLICPSAFTARLHKEFFGEIPIEVLPPFYSPDPEEMTGGQSPGRRDRPYFVYVGRFEPIKGVDRLVRAFRSVRGADLFVIGEGSQEQQLRRLADGCSNIIFTGWLEHHEILALCRSALALVVPSSGYETFGGVAVEAMASGIPALVRDLGPLPELVADGGGWTFTDDDDLSRQLQELVDEPGRAASAGRKAAEIYQARWAIERLFERYFGLIRDAANRTGRGELADRANAAAQKEARQCVT